MPTKAAATATNIPKKGKKGKDAPKKRRHEVVKKEILTTNSPGLTKKQIAYESKYWPKHYKP